MSARVVPVTSSGHVSSVRYRAGKGEPLLLLHGFSASADTWGPILPALERHHEVIAVTFPGHMGGEPIPPGFPHTIAASVDLAERELDMAGWDKLHIVGNSLGGWIALELARRGRAKSVVAISPGGGWTRDSREAQRLEKLFKNIKASLHVGGPIAPFLARFAATRRVALGRIVARPERMSAADARMMITASWRCDVFDDVVRALKVEVEPTLLHPLPCPIRLVWGTRDRILPMSRYSHHWRSVLPGAEWVELGGLGHVPMFDDPDVVARTILEMTTRSTETAALAS
jgi:pimeloyl-ACP methyl ester carboxylesterase